MDDFTKPVIANVNSLNQEKQDEWLTKDRFWNFVFWFGMSSGLSLGTFIKFTLKMPDLFPVVAWSVLLGVPLIVTLANRTRFIEKDTFVNSKGMELTKKQMPTGNFIWLTILGLALTFGLSDKYAGRHVISSFISFTGLFSGFCLYFIFKNCPVSILFNYKFWVWKSRHSASCPNFKSTPYNPPKYTSSTFRPNDLITNPIYGGLSCNIYNKHRR
jgi:hypothetical protein